MDGATWERLLHTPTTWIVVAAVLFVLAVVLLIAGARAGRRAARAQQEQATTDTPTPVPDPTDADADPVTEPAVPRQNPAPITSTLAEEDPVTEPATPRPAPAAPPTTAGTSTSTSTTDDPATRRLLAALVGDPTAAIAAVSALGRGEEPGRAAVTLLRSGVPAPAVARLCGVDADDLAGLVASTLGVLPEQARSVVAAH